MGRSQSSELFGTPTLVEKYNLKLPSRTRNPLDGSLGGPPQPLAAPCCLSNRHNGAHDHSFNDSGLRACFDISLPLPPMAIGT